MFKKFSQAVINLITKSVKIPPSPLSILTSNSSNSLIEKDEIELQIMKDDLLDLEDIKEPISSNKKNNLSLDNITNV